jgi:hypothetical protein
MTKSADDRPDDSAGEPGTFDLTNNVEPDLKEGERHNEGPLPADLETARQESDAD